MDRETYKSGKETEHMEKHVKVFGAPKRKCKRMYLGNITLKEPSFVTKKKPKQIVAFATTKIPCMISDELFPVWILSFSLR